MVLVNPATSFENSPWPALGPLLPQVPKVCAPASHIGYCLELAKAYSRIGGLCGVTKKNAKGCSHDCTIVCLCSDSKPCGRCQPLLFGHLHPESHLCCRNCIMLSRWPLHQSWGTPSS